MSVCYSTVYETNIAVTRRGGEVGWGERVVYAADTLTLIILTNSYTK